MRCKGLTNMKTARSIEEQEARKAEEKSKAEGKTDPVFPTHNSGSVSGRRGRVENLKPWPKGVSGNPGGKPKIDLAAEIARAIFQNDGLAIYVAYRKMLRKGSPYAFQVLSDRAFGKMKESIQHEVRPYAEQTDEEIRERIQQLEKELGISRSAPEALPPASDPKTS
jgi:hypothetical protein